MQQRLNRAWLLAFARPIRPDELALARHFLASRPEKSVAEAWTELCLALINASEFVYVD
jgi:hypothetical protein